MNAKLDPRVKRTRQLLQDALKALLGEKTFQHITVQDIAERAEVNRATFYAHFEDKYALLNYSVRTTFQGMLAAKLPPAPRLSRENLRLLILTLCEYLGNFIGHCAPPQHDEQAMMVMQVQRSTHETLLEWLKRSAVASAEMLAITSSWAIFGAVLQWGQTGRKLAPEHLADNLLTHLSAGLGEYLSLPEKAPISS